MLMKRNIGVFFPEMFFIIYCFVLWHSKFYPSRIFDAKYSVCLLQYSVQIPYRIHISIHYGDLFSTVSVDAHRHLFHFVPLFMDEWMFVKAEQPHELTDV